MNRRPIVNTRDEPHADTQAYRRFHVIVGDANMSQWATALKIGTTALVLELIEKGHAPQLDLANPIEATKSISRDQTYAWIIELRDGRKISALDIQRLYLAAARDYCDLDNEDTLWTLREWEHVLNDLAVDVMRCRDRLDWVAKKFLLTTFREAENLEWSDPWLQSIDLEYHNVSLEHGLYYELVRTNQMKRLVEEDEIRRSIFQPPETTRAYFRGRAVARFNREISSIQWDEVCFQHNGDLRTVNLPHPAHAEELARANAAIRDAKSFADFIASLGPE
jgi:proteasome accessory factor A